MAIVSICRGTRSGGKAMAECLAAELGYPLLGREVLQEAAERLGVPARMLEARMCDRPGVWSRFSTMRRVYVAAVKAALAERAEGGDLVYHGLAGGFLLKDAPCAFCIRLIAPMERRAAAVMADADIGREDAEAYIRDVDASRARWVRVMYDADVMDPSLYDLVINLAGITVEGACSLTRRALAHPEFEVTETTRARLRDFRVATGVEVALAADPALRSLDLAATARDGAVTITGQAPLLHSGRTGNRIAEIAHAVPGVGQVRLEVGWFDPYP